MPIEEQSVITTTNITLAANSLKAGMAANCVEIIPEMLKAL